MPFALELLAHLDVESPVDVLLYREDARIEHGRTLLEILEAHVHCRDDGQLNLRLELREGAIELHNNGHRIVPRSRPCHCLELLSVGRLSLPRWSLPLPGLGAPECFHDCSMEAWPEVQARQVQVLHRVLEAVEAPHKHLRLVAEAFDKARVVALPEDPEDERLGRVLGDLVSVVHQQPRHPGHVDSLVQEVNDKNPARHDVNATGTVQGRPLGKGHLIGDDPGQFIRPHAFREQHIGVDLRVSLILGCIQTKHKGTRQLGVFADAVEPQELAQEPLETARL
eukprot:scaffold7340_cov266-Pinguiococcus_pyrenoidosus.AAC.82